MTMTTRTRTIMTENSAAAVVVVKNTAVVATNTIATTNTTELCRLIGRGDFRNAIGYLHHHLVQL